MAMRPPNFKTSTRKTAPAKWSATSKAGRKARGYGHDWDKLRAAVIQSEPICRACRVLGRATPTQQVDHIVPKSLGGSDARTNLQGLCKTCHKAKTAREGRAARAAHTGFTV